MTTRVRALAPLLWMAVIFYGSAQADPAPGFGNLAHVIAHFSEYALLAALWIWALIPALGRRAAVVSAAICVLYSVSDELHQSFVPHRDSDPVDVLVDSVGIAVVVGLSLMLARRAPSHGQRTSH